MKPLEVNCLHRYSVTDRFCGLRTLTERYKNYKLWLSSLSLVWQGTTLNYDNNGQFCRVYHGPLLRDTLGDTLHQHYSDWVCTAVMSNDVMKDLRG